MMKILKKAREDKRLLILSKRRKTIKKAEDKIITSFLINLMFLAAVFLFSLINLTDIEINYFNISINVIILPILIISCSKLFKNNNKHTKTYNKINKKIKDIKETNYKIEDNIDLYFKEILKLRSVNQLDLVEKDLLNDVLNLKRKSDDVKKFSNDEILNNFLNIEYIDLLKQNKIKESIDIS